jgi:sensitive to high expression protein 9
MFRLVVLRTFQRLYCGGLLKGSVGLLGSNGNNGGLQRRYLSRSSKLQQELKRERDLGDLTKEEKTKRKLELQEQLKRLEAAEDADKVDETDDNKLSSSVTDERQHVKSLGLMTLTGQKEPSSMVEDDQKSVATSSIRTNNTKCSQESTSDGASVRRTNVENVKNGDNMTIMEQENARNVSVEDNAEVNAATTDVLEEPASVSHCKAVPYIDEKINEQIHREIDNLPSKMEERKSEWSKKLANYLESLQETILTATRALNDVTGYSAIEKLKNSITKLEDELKESKATVKMSKKAYGEAINLRSQSQREVNELLTRKHNWSSDDLERFTELYRNDHTNELRENEAQKQLNDAEQIVDGIQLKLTQLILTRYHEEQIWSDKIRQASTWGTWIIMGFNLLLFIIATFFVEPWKRKRLVDAFEKQVKETLMRTSAVDQGNNAPVLEQIDQGKAAEQSPTWGEVEPGLDAVETRGHTDAVSIVSSTSIYPISFKLVDRSWQGLKNTISTNFSALTAKNIDELQFKKVDLAVLAVVFTSLGGTIGSLITLYINSK